ncbi:hypothetical protein VTK26DRAFT_6674 [Humicola hyalothermophila]
MNSAPTTLVDPVIMGSTIAKGATAQAQKATPSKSAASSASSAGNTSKDAQSRQLHPVQTIQTPAAQAARHALPALLAGLFLVRFGALVDDPVSTMSSSLPLTAALQVAYAVVCLPVAGSSQAGGSGTGVGGAARKGPRPGEKKRGGAGTGGDARGPNRVVTALLALVLSLLVTPALHAVVLLFGAPFLTHASATLLFASHLALLALFPLFYVHGVDGAAWVAVGGFSAPIDETFGGLVGALAGAWLGAVPIPLDWDREWQKWPVTILCGLYAGYLLGRVIGGTVAWGRKF